MHGTIRGAALSASKGGGKFAVQVGGTGKPEPPNVKSDVDWFAKMAWNVHPEKPGTNLHLTTGVDERLCQKYAAGSVRPSSSFLRALLRSDEGWDYLACVMDGAQPAWWLEIQRARRIAEAIRESNA